MWLCGIVKLHRPPPREVAGLWPLLGVLRLFTISTCPGGGVILQCHLNDCVRFQKHGVTQSSMCKNISSNHIMVIHIYLPVSHQKQYSVLIPICTQPVIYLRTHEMTPHTSPSGAFKQKETTDSEFQHGGLLVVVLFHISIRAELLHHAHDEIRINDCRLMTCAFPNGVDSFSDARWKRTLL